jgi:hypothetical protein
MIFHGLFPHPTAQFEGCSTIAQILPLPCDSSFTDAKTSPVVQLTTYSSLYLETLSHIALAFYMPFLPFRMMIDGPSRGGPSTHRSARSGCGTGGVMVAEVARNFSAF